MSYRWSKVKVCVAYGPPADTAGGGASPSPPSGDSSAARFSDSTMLRASASTRTTFSNGRSPCSSRSSGGRTRITTLKLLLCLSPLLPGDARMIGDSSSS